MPHNNNNKIAVITSALAISIFACSANANAAPSYTNAQISSPTLSETAIHYIARPFSGFVSLTRWSIGLASKIAPNGNSKTASLTIPSADMVVTNATPKPAGRPAAIPAQTRNAATAAAFDTVAVPFKRLSALKKLAPSLEEMERGAAIDCRGSACKTATAINLAAAGTTQGSLRDKLNAVNAIVNKTITYRSDMETNGTTDHWSTPSETLIRGQGDCEDFAILKMAALRAQGVDPASMSIIALFDQKRGLYHAVLSVEVGGRHFILDNVRNQVLQDSQIPEYVALYSIRDSKGYLHGSQRQKQIAGVITSLEKVAPGAGIN